MIRKTITLLSLVLLMAFVGCSNNPADTTQNAGELDLSSEFGGYSATSEAFAFEDPQLITESNDDTDYGDPILSSPGFDSLNSHPEAGRYHLRIAWGKLRYDSTVTTNTDWTGSLEISRGGEVIRRLIHWELNQDYIIPRTNRKLIEWVSFTSVHNDGIAVDLIVPPLPPVFDSSYIWETDMNGDSIQVLVIDTLPPVADPVEVTFTTGPYTRTFNLEELASLDTIVYVADSNAVAFHALKSDKRDCPAGFFNGFWGYDDEGRGRFSGMWITEDGYISGYIKGHFGVNDEGRNVLFGKYISRSGQFEGFIKGTYHERWGNNSDSTMTKGFVVARIVNSERMPIGVLKGRYSSSSDMDNGFMQGRWKLRCRDGGNDNSEDSMNDGMGNGM